MSYATRSMFAAVAVVAAGLLGSSAHAAATIYNLGTLGGTYSVGNAINASGQVAGYSYLAGGAQHAFRYTGTPGIDGAMADLGGGAPGSTGTAINASGQVAGGSDLTGNAANHAFLYTGAPGSDGAMVDLGALPGGTISLGNAINASGQVAGYSTTASGNHAFLYTGTPGVDGQMIDLDAWLKANNPAEGAKWTLTNAYGLNDNGLITGYGTYNDGLSNGTRAFILDASALVPEPGSLLLLALGGLPLLRRRRRA